MPVEALFPEGGERFELGSSGWSWVLGIDAVGGPPHCNVADEGGARVTSRWCPDWHCVTLANVVLDPVGEVGDQLGDKNPRRDGHGALVECPRARAVDLGW